MKILKYFSATAIIFSIFFVIGCASTPTSSSAGEMIDDTVITAKVKTAIFNEKELSAAEINVETFKGVVQLSGFVSQRSDIAKASTVTLAVGGVTSVRNDIVVK